MGIYANIWLNTLINLTQTPCSPERSEYNGVDEKTRRRRRSWWWRSGKAAAAVNKGGRLCIRVRAVG